MNKIGFRLYLLFTVSWFLHLTARFSFLGLLRFDLLLILVILATMVVGKKGEIQQSPSNDTSRALKILFVYVLVTLPFVQWPGSVLNAGIPNFIKAVVFYYFSIFFLTSEKKLKIFIAVFLSCQCIRVFEPVYLHLTQGYWGSFATMGGYEFMDRLAGAPSDIVNPNGLAFIILSTVPFLYYFSFLSWGHRILSLTVLPVLLYALALTGSRSGVIGLLAIMIGIVMKSRKKMVLLIAFVGVIALIYASLNADQKDRYLSIFDSDTKNAATASGRMQGTLADFEVALRKPFVGHGLGTSLEANANFAGIDIRAHNLWAEVAQELGFVGLIIFVYFVRSIIMNFLKSMKGLKEVKFERSYLGYLVSSMQVWLLMNLIFSFASYGLSSYEWYLFAGLSVVARRLSEVHKNILPMASGSGL